MEDVKTRPGVNALLRGSKRGQPHLFKIHKIDNEFIYGLEWPEGQDPLEHGVALKIAVEALDKDNYEIVDE